MANFRVHTEEDLDRLFHALAHPTRRQVLKRLAAEGDLSPKDLRDASGLAKSTFSKHLAVLEQAGLIRRLDWGHDHRCRIDGKRVLKVQQWLGRTVVKTMQRERFAKGAFRRGPHAS